MTQHPILATVGTVTAFLPAALHNELTVPLLGVTVTSVGAAMLCTLAVSAWAEPIEPRWPKLYLVVLGSAVLACVTVAILPAFGFEWATKAPQGPLCGVLAGIYRLFLGVAAMRGRQLISAFNPMDWLPSRKAGRAPLAEADKAAAPPGE